MNDFGFAFDSINMLIITILGQYLDLADKLSLKDIILRNFIARSANFLKSIQLVWNNQCYSDAWILYRCLLDRLLYLRYLNETNSWKDFDDWSFKLQYEYQNKAKSDQELKKYLQESEFQPTLEQKHRYKALTVKKIHWTKPIPENVLKKMDLKFLYDYGYSFGSGFVHPLSSDGLYDFAELVGINEEYPYKNPKYAINNSIIVGTLILQEALNCSDFKWMSIVYDSIDEIREYTGTSNIKGLSQLMKLVAYVKQGPDYKICSYENH